MTIEEKAKRYDEAIEQLRAMMPNWESLSYNCKMFLQDLVYIIPELKGSEDERIRKSLIVLLQHFCKGYRVPGLDFPVSYKDMLAWLEKQGNKDMGISEATKQKLEDNLNKALEKETPESWNEFLEKQGEQKPKFRVGDTIKCKYDGRQFTIKSVDLDKGTYTYTQEGCGNDIDYADEEFELVEQKPAWSEEDEAIYYGVIETEQYMLDVVNGIKKFNVGNISIKEECTRELNWLESLKERVQPKQEWSEEDENRINRLIAYFEDKESFTAEDDIVYANWLKSLRPQSTWKPSDEQMTALKHASNDCSIAFADMKILAILYEQLKALYRYE